MVEKTLILKQISGMLCLLNSYSKFTRPDRYYTLKKTYLYVILKMNKGKARAAAYPQQWLTVLVTAVIIASNGGYFRFPLKTV